jgi:hypothetical protein
MFQACVTRFDVTKILKKIVIFLELNKAILLMQRYTHSRRVYSRIKKTKQTIIQSCSAGAARNDTPVGPQ